MTEGGAAGTKGWQNGEEAVAQVQLRDGSSWDPVEWEQLWGGRMGWFPGIVFS